MTGERRYFRHYWELERRGRIDREKEKEREKLHATIMQSTFSPQLVCLCALTLSFAIYPVWLQTLPKKTATSKNGKDPGCCEELKKLKVQVANLSSLLEEMSKKQDDVLGHAVTQVMALEESVKLMDARLNDVEGKYSEMNSQLGIVQLQAAQTVTQTSTGKERSTGKIP